MQRVLTERRSWREASGLAWTIRAAMLAVAIALGLVAAYLFASATPLTGRSATTVSVRGYGTTQEAVHGNLAGGDDGYFVQVGGEGPVP